MSLDTVVNHEARPKPPFPPHHPVHPPKPMPTKNVVLSHRFGHTIYALAVRTTTDAVFDKNYRYSLTEMLCDLSDALTTNLRKINDVSEKFNALMADCPEEFNTLKEIADYISVTGDPKSALIELIDTKVDKEEGKGLSTNDFTDILKAKLENDYTKEELDEKFDLQAAFNAAQEEFNAEQRRINEAQATVNENQSQWNANQTTINETQTAFNEGQIDFNNEVDARVVELENAPNIIVDESDPDIKDNSVWFHVEDEYEGN